MVIKNDAFFDGLFSLVDDLAFVIDESGLVVKANKVALDKLGYSEDEIYKLRVIELHPKSRYDEVISIFKQMVDGDLENCPVPLISKKNELIPVSTKIKPIEHEGTKYILGISKHLNTIDLDYHRLQKTFAHNPMPMALSNYETGEYFDVNDAFINTFGYSKSEIIGRSSTALFEGFTQTVRAGLLHEVEKYGKVRGTKIKFKNKYGKNFFGLLTGEVTEVGGIKYAITTFQDLSLEQKLINDLINSELRWKFALDSSDLAVWDWNLVTNEVSFSVNWKIMLGYEPFELGNNLEEWDSRIHPDDKKKAYDDIDNYLSGNTKIYSNIHRLMTKSGSYKWIQDTGKIMEWDDDGKPIRMIGTHRDITNDKLAEIQLKEEKAKLENFFNVNLDLLCIADFNGNFLKVNKEWESVLGYSIEFLESSKFLDFVHPDDIQATLDVMDSVLVGNESLYFTNRYICKDGSHRFIEWRSQPEGNLIYAAARDITNRIENEQRLRENEEKYRVMFDDSSDAYFIIENNLIVESNKSAAQMVALEIDEIIGMSPSELSPKYQPNGELSEVLANRYVQQALEFGTARFEWIHKKSDGSEFWVEVYLTKMIYNNREVVFASWRDISESKQISDTLSKQLGLINSLIDSMPDIIFFKDLEGIYIGCNPQFIEFVGRNKEEIIGKSDYDFFDKNVADSFREYDNLMLKNLKTSYNEEKVTYPDGRVKILETLKTPYWAADGKLIGLLGLSRDITERKQVERELAHSNELMKYIIEHTHSSISVFDTEMNYVYVSNRYYKDLKVVDNVIGKNHYDVFPYLPEHILDAHRRALKGEVLSAEAEQLFHPDGTSDWTNWQCRPWYKSDETIGGIIVYLELITERKKAELELQESEAMLNYFFNQSTAGFFFMMLDEPVFWNDDIDKEKTLDYVFEHQRVTRINHAMLNQYLSTEEETIGRTPKDLFAHNIEHGREVWRQFFDRGVLHIETDERKSDGSTMYVLGDYVCLYDSVGRITGHFGLQLDVTESVLAKSKLEESALLLKNLSAQLPGVIYQYRYHPDGRNYFPFASDSMYNIFGITPDQVKDDSSPIFSRIHPDDLDETFASIVKSFETLEMWEYECRIVLPESDEKWLRGTAKPAKLDDGSVLWHGYIKDITEKKLDDIEIKKIKEQYELSIAGSNDGIWDWDIVNNKLFLSTRWKEILGYKDSELSNEFDTFTKLLADEDKERVNSYINAYFVGGIDKYQMEFKMKHKDGSYRWILAKGEALRNEDGTPYRMAGSHSDITDRKLIEAALLKSDQLLKKLTAQLPGIIYQFVMTPDGRTYVPYTNDNIYLIFELKPDDVKKDSKLLFERIHPDDLKKVTKAIKQSKENLSTWEVDFRVVLPKQGVRWLYGNANPELSDDGNVVWFGYINDITEKKKSEIELRKSKEQYELAIAGTSDGIWDWDIDNNTIFKSARWKSMLGFSADEIQDDFNSFDNLLHPDDKQRVQDTLQSYLENKIDKYEIEFRLKHKDGSYKWILARASALRDEQGKPYRMAGSHTDITERKESEEKIKLFAHDLEWANWELHSEIETRVKAEQELAERNEDLLMAHDAIEQHAANLVELNNKLLESEEQLIEAVDALKIVSAEKDKFFSIIAHDLRSPFNGFLGLTRMMSEDVEEMPREEIKSLLDSLRDSAQSFYELLENLLSWAKIQRGVMDYKPENTYLYMVADSIIDSQLANTTLKRITVENNIEADVEVFTDYFILNTVIRNLLSNAIKFTTEGGCITFDAKLNGDKYIVSIKDTGIGMPESLVSKIFVIGEKTSREGTNGERSSGLGLLLCKDYIELNGGNIFIESEENIGTTISFTLPKAR